MARPKKYATAAQKQKAYRVRKRLESFDEHTRQHVQGYELDLWIREQAALGDPVAAQIVGTNYMDTAVRLLAYLDKAALKCARSVSLLAGADDAAPGVDS